MQVAECRKSTMYIWGVVNLVSEPGLDFLEESRVRNYRVTVVVMRGYRILLE